MMICAAALALAGVTLMAFVAMSAQRGGYRCSTMFTRRRAARLARLAARPVPSADQRVATAPGSRRLRHRLGRRTVVAPASQATLSAPVRRVTFDAVDAWDEASTHGRGRGTTALDRAVAVTIESAAERGGAGNTDDTTTRRSVPRHSTQDVAAAAHLQAAEMERVVMGFDGVAADPQMLAALRRRVEIVPEVIEADPIDVDVVNPARLTRSR